MRNDEVLQKAEEGFKESNKILIRELIRDLEEKGIAPVIAVDGEVKKLKCRLIHESELEDYESVLKRHGFTQSDFCLLEENTTSQASNCVYPVTGNVILINKKSAKVKKYTAGNGSHWIADFHYDLERNLFSN
jgi:hypothetical protein